MLDWAYSAAGWKLILGVGKVCSYVGTNVGNAWVYKRWDVPPPREA